MSAGALEPRRIGPFLLGEERGRDEVGTTWSARDERTGAAVDLRLLPAGLARNNLVHVRFLRDAERAAAVDHPGVVRVLQGGEAGGELYLVSEPAGGRTLEEILEEARGAPPEGDAAPLPGEGAGPFERVASFFEGLARALEAVHAAGLVHGRIGPRRVLAAPDGTPRLRDLGLPGPGMLGELPLDRPPERATPWSAPESLDPMELVDPRADVYSLGALLYHCLALRPPFEEATTEGLAWRLRTADPVPLRRWNRAVPRPLARIVSNAMARDRGPRYRTAGEMAADLRRFLEGRRIPLRREGLVGHVVRWPVRHPVLIFVVLVLVVVFEGGFLLLWHDLEMAVVEDRVGELRHTTLLNQKRLATTTSHEVWMQTQRALEPILAASEDLESADPDLAILLAREVVERTGTREWSDHHDARALRARAVDRLRAALRNDREVHCSRSTGVAVTHLAPSPLSGGAFATAAADGSVRVWSATGAEVAWARGHTGPVRSLKGVPLADLFVSASADGTARVRRTDGSLLGVYAGHGRPLNAADVDFAGESLVTAGEEGVAHLWSLSTGDRTASLHGHTGPILDAAFEVRPGGRVATASADGTARLWNREGRETALLRGHAGPVTRVAWGFGEEGLLTLSEDGTVRTWAADGSPRLVLSHGAEPTVFRRLGGGRLLTGDADGRARLWEADGRLAAALAVAGGAVTAVDGSEESGLLLLAAADGTVRLLREDGVEVDRFACTGGAATGACFGPWGASVHAGFADGSVRTWKREAGEFPGFPVGLPPGGVVLASYAPFPGRGGGGHLEDSLERARLRAVLSPGAGSGGDPLPDLLAEIRIKDGAATAGDLTGPPVRHGVLARDRHRLAVGGEDGVVRLFDGKGKPKGEWTGTDSPVTALCLLPDRGIAAGHADGSVRFRSEGRGFAPPVMPSPKVHGVAVTGFAWDEHSGTLVSLSAGGEFLTWDVRGKGPRASTPSRRGPGGPLAGAAWSRTFGPGLRRCFVLVARDGGFAVHDERGRPYGKGGRLPEGGVRAVAAGREGGYLVITDSGDGRCRVWSIERDGSGFRRVATLPGHGTVVSAVFGAAVSSGGRMRVATACSDGTVRLYALDEAELLDLSRKRVPREVTADEARRLSHLSLRRAPAKGRRK